MRSRGVCGLLCAMIAVAAAASCECLLGRLFPSSRHIERRARNPTICSCEKDFPIWPPATSTTATLQAAAPLTDINKNNYFRKNGVKKFKRAARKHMHTEDTSIYYEPAETHNHFYNNDFHQQLFVLTPLNIQQQIPLSYRRNKPVYNPFKSNSRKERPLIKAISRRRINTIVDKDHEAPASELEARDSMYNAHLFLDLGVDHAIARDASSDQDLFKKSNTDNILTQFSNCIDLHITLKHKYLTQSDDETGNLKTTPSEDTSFRTEIFPGDYRLEDVKKLCSDLGNLLMKNINFIKISSKKNNEPTEIVVTKPPLDIALHKAGVANYYDESTDSELSDSVPVEHIERYPGGVFKSASEFIKDIEKYSDRNLNKSLDSFKTASTEYQDTTTYRPNHYTAFDYTPGTTSYKQTYRNRNLEEAWPQPSDGYSKTTPNLSEEISQKTTTVSEHSAVQEDTKKNSNFDWTTGEIDPHFSITANMDTATTAGPVSSIKQRMLNGVAVSENIVSIDGKVGNNVGKGTISIEPAYQIFSEDTTLHSTSESEKATTSTPFYLHEKSSDVRIKDLSMDTESSTDIWTTLDPTTHIYTIQPGRPTIEEANVKIPKVISQEFKNGSTFSKVDDLEKLPNNDFVNLTETHSKDILSFSKYNYSGIYHILKGKIVFLHNKNKIPMKFVQSRNGDIDLGIDGNFICNHLRADSYKSMLLSVLCNST